MVGNRWCTQRSFANSMGPIVLLITKILENKQRMRKPKHAGRQRCIVRFATVVQIGVGGGQSESDSVSAFILQGE